MQLLLLFLRALGATTDTSPRVMMGSPDHPPPPHQRTCRRSCSLSLPFLSFQQSGQSIDRNTSPHPTLIVKHASNWIAPTCFVISTMSAADGSLCALCSTGCSNDRLLLHCSNRACSSGSWFHLDCIGAAIISRNVKKVQPAWLCPWCVLEQSSSLSERQLLALTLQVSQLDSLRPRAVPSVDHSVNHVAVRSDPRPGPSSSSNVCSANGTAPSASNSITSKKKRSIAAVSALPVLSNGQYELTGTCAKCRREY
jgi:hypothetical protein